MVEHIGEELRTCFSAFRETLIYLSLAAFATSFSGFVTLTDYFPNIATLELRPFAVKPDEGPVPSLSRPFRGKLQVYSIPALCFEFFDRFAKLDLEYEELVIGSCSIVWVGILKSILQISTKTVKYLRLTAGSQCE